MKAVRKIRTPYASFDTRTRGTSPDFAAMIVRAPRMVYSLPRRWEGCPCTVRDSRTVESDTEVQERDAAHDGAAPGPMTSESEAAARSVGAHGDRLEKNVRTCERELYTCELGTKELTK